MKQSNTTRNKRIYSLKNLKFSYDKLNDLLYAYKQDSNIYSDVIIGDFHLEFNKNMEIVGIELLNASDILSDYGIPKKILVHLQ